MRLSYRDLTASGGIAASPQTGDPGRVRRSRAERPSLLGTAIVGAVLLGSLATGFSDRITNNPDVPPAARETIVAKAEQGIDIVPVAAVEDAAVKGGLTPDQARAVADDYGDAQLDALRLSLGAVALTALLSLWLTRRLPTKAETDVGPTEATAVA
jgi:hypothetical protein